MTEEKNNFIEKAKAILLLFVIIVFFSIYNSVLAIKYYDSIIDIEIKNNLYYFWIMAIINIICISLCFIIFIIFFYMYNHNNISNIYINIIKIFAIITFLISCYVNLSLFMYYCENKKYSNTDKLLPIFTYMLYIPLWYIMLYSFDILTYKNISETNIIPSTNFGTNTNINTTDTNTNINTTGTATNINTNTNTTGTATNINTNTNTNTNTTIQQIPLLIPITGASAAL